MSLVSKYSSESFVRRVDAYGLKDKSGKLVYQFNDLDSMYIQIKLDTLNKSKKQKEEEMRVDFPHSSVNLTTMTAKLKVNSKVEYNLDRLNEAKRMRHSYSRRVSQLELDISNDFNSQSETYAFLKNYGFKWST